MIANALPVEKTLFCGFSIVCAGRCAPPFSILRILRMVLGYVRRAIIPPKQGPSHQGSLLLHEPPLAQTLIQLPLLHL